MTLAGDVLYELGRLCEAATRWQRVLEVDHQHSRARRRLANVLAISGRKEAARLFFEIVKGGTFSVQDLSLLGDLELKYDDSECEKLFAVAVPSDACVAHGAARYALHRHDSHKAAELYRKLAERLPADVEVLAGLGSALVEAGTDDEFLNWHSHLPDAADEHPEIWIVRGRFAQRRSVRYCHPLLR